MGIPEKEDIKTLHGTNSESIFLNIASLMRLQLHSHFNGDDAFHFIATWIFLVHAYIGAHPSKTVIRDQHTGTCRPHQRSDYSFTLHLYHPALV
jgi:hypothetical protein